MSLHSSYNTSPHSKLTCFLRPVVSSVVVGLEVVSSAVSQGFSLLSVYLPSPRAVSPSHLVLVALAERGRVTAVALLLTLLPELPKLPLSSYCRCSSAGAAALTLLLLVLVRERVRVHVVDF